MTPSALGGFVFQEPGQNNKSKDIRESLNQYGDMPLSRGIWFWKYVSVSAYPNNIAANTAYSGL